MYKSKDGTEMIDLQNKKLHEGMVDQILQNRFQIVGKVA